MPSATIQSSRRVSTLKETRASRGAAKSVKALTIPFRAGANFAVNVSHRYARRNERVHLLIE